MNESITNTATPDAEIDCFVKAKGKGEPTFTLRAQDITADIFVEGWACAQLFMKQRMAEGYSQEEAVNVLRDRMRMIVGSDFFSADIIADHVKAEGALKKANLMREWPIKKLAD